MHEILSNLPGGAYALDVGSARESYTYAAFRATTIRLDIEPPTGCKVDLFVQADAARMPFPAGLFDAVVCCHSLEHIKELKLALCEIGRVLKPGGSLFVSVPDASALTDRIFRFMAGPGGGHVNLFNTRREVAELVEKHTGLEHVATRILCTSLAFLHRQNRAQPVPRLKSYLFLRGWERYLVLLNAMFRLLDRYLGTRMSVYGWALYFGSVNQPIDTTPWTNVCVCCGQGHPSSWLLKIGAVRRRWANSKQYACPDCGTINYFFPDESHAFMNLSQ